MRDAGAMSERSTFDVLIESTEPAMLIVTAGGPGGPSGCLVGFSTQASIRPERHLVLLSKENHTYAVAQDSPVLAVHVLRASDHELAERFGGESGDDTDKFAGLEVVDGPGGVPVIAGLDWFAGRVLRQFDCGDHVAFLLAAHDGSASRVGEAPLTLRESEDIEPGHSA